MSKKLRASSGLLTIFAALALSGPAGAATVIYDFELDLNTASFVGSNLSVSIPSGPTNLNVGDVLQGTVSFVNGQRLELADAGNSLEGVILWFFPTNGSANSIDGTFTFLGGQGDFNGPITSSGWSASGGLAVGNLSNITATPFSFSGFTYSLNYSSGTASAFTVRFETIQSNASIITAVPEPSTWAMMIMGFGGIGYAMRRRRKAVAPVQCA